MTSLASLPIGSLKWTCRLKEATDNAAYRSIFRSRPGGQAAICSAMGFVLARDPEGAEGGKCFRGNLDRRNLARLSGVTYALPGIFRACALERIAKQRMVVGYFGYSSYSSWAIIWLP
jgi:hypothetical protein